MAVNITYTTIVDSREQKPYAFKKRIVQKIDSADYTIEGHESCIGVERKSESDWRSSIVNSKKRKINNRARLEAEIIRAGKQYKTYYLMIESDLPKLWKRSKYSQMQPSSVVGTSIKWMEKYKHLKVIYASNRTQAQIFIKKLFDAHIEHCTGGKENGKKEE